MSTKNYEEINPKDFNIYDTSMSSIKTVKMTVLGTLNLYLAIDKLIKDIDSKTDELNSEIKKINEAFEDDLTDRANFPLDKLFTAREDKQKMMTLKISLSLNKNNIKRILEEKFESLLQSSKTTTLENIKEEKAGSRVFKNIIKEEVSYQIKLIPDYAFLIMDIPSEELEVLITIIGLT